MGERANTVDDAGAEGSLAIIHADADYALGRLDNYLLSVWRQEIPLVGAAHWGRALNELRGAQPGTRFGALSYIEISCRFPISPDVLQSFVDHLRRYRDVFGAAALIYNREGFWGAGVRSQVTSIMTESKTDVPYLVALTADAAVGWLLQTLHDAKPGRAAVVARGLEQLRATSAAPEAR